MSLLRLQYVLVPTPLHVLHTPDLLGKGYCCRECSNIKGDTLSRCKGGKAGNAGVTPPALFVHR